MSFETTVENTYVLTQETWVWLLASFCILVLLVFLLVVRPLFARLDSEVKRTRALLLIIPEDVVESQPAVQAFMVREYRHYLKSK